MNNERALGPLILALKDEDLLVRTAATLALGEIEDEDGEIDAFDRFIDKKIIELIDNLREECKRKKMEVVDEDGSYELFGMMHSLIDISQRAAYPLIEIVKEDKDNDFRNWILYALGEMRSEKAVDPLIQILNTDPDHNIRNHAIFALGNIGSEKAVGPLVHTLKDDDAKIRVSATLALLKMGQKMRSNLSLTC